VYRVGIDIGYGFCKAYNGVDTKVFPARVRVKAVELFLRTQENQ
jgi:hypothetical protein